MCLDVISVLLCLELILLVSLVAPSIPCLKKHLFGKYKIHAKFGICSRKLKKSQFTLRLGH
jgi:hypothetical protein